MEEVCEVCVGYGGCVDGEEAGVAVVGYAAEAVLLQWLLGYTAARGDGCLSCWIY